MTILRITVGPLHFMARWDTRSSPRTCAAFRELLPYRQKIIHARWSGEACWIPLGDFRLGVGPENPTGEPAPGEILFYPGGRSETEILFPYGVSRFACKDGRLEGNRFLVVVDGREHLAEMGRRVLWEGAQDIAFEEIPESPGATRSGTPPY
jgi:hypothetical protein